VAVRGTWMQTTAGSTLCGQPVANPQVEFTIVRFLGAALQSNGIRDDVYYTHRGQQLREVRNEPSLHCHGHVILRHICEVVFSRILLAKTRSGNTSHGFSNGAARSAIRTVVILLAVS
jgi:hypothetical protein